MGLFRTVATAFSMYSSIPMPKLDWDEGNTKYLFCAFPLVGVPIGAAVWGWGLLCGWLQFGALLRGAGMALLPLLISGGIHMDGFCDTCDALASHAPREKKLAILKDSQAGAFAVIGAVAYLLLYTALLSELATDQRTLVLLGLGFVLSRTLSGISVVRFPKAKADGTVAYFSTAAHRKRVFTVLMLVLLLIVGALLGIGAVSGLLVALAAGIVFLYYYILSRRQFGGITGDLAGYFLQLCELSVPVALLVAQSLRAS